ncbi:MAG: glutamine synthetase family protein [Steroidobacteraceae bacterium]
MSDYIDIAAMVDSSEARRFLDANPDIAAVQIFATDPSGVARGKSIARDELLSFFTSGRRVAASLLGLDMLGEDVDETGLVWDIGDADQLALPVAGSLQRCSWLRRPTGQVMLTLHDTNGRPFAADPRHVLARVIKEFDGLDLVPVLACELEFYLVRRSPSGRVRCLTSSGQVSIDSYDLRQIDEYAVVFDAIHDAAREQGIQLGTLMSEYAPGQFEITLPHRADALRAVDEAVLFKRLVKGVASRHGLTATFMAKPFAQFAGNGLHIHVSVRDRSGTNAFASDDPQGNALLRSAIAGMQQHMAESMLAFAPNANSYRRFRRKSYAPVAPTWGVNNRSVGLRIPAGSAESRHIEHRISGADANLYLAVAATLAAALQGMRHGAVPDKPVSGNGYLAAETAPLPLYWQAAIDSASRSAFLKQAFGADFMKIWLAIKVSEYAKFNAEVTAQDHAWYLERC